MDRYSGRKGKWFALGVLALVFLCIVTCIGAAAMFSLRPAGTWVQPPAGEGAVNPPEVFYPSYGIWGFLGAGIGLLFKLLLFGLLLLALLKLVGRFLWGRWHAVPPCGYGPWPGASQGAPRDEAEGSEPGVGWGSPPWTRHTWRHHRHPHPGHPPAWWGPPPGPATQAGPEGEAGEGEPDAPSGEYTGPME
jgi:hypothetical protein